MHLKFPQIWYLNDTATMVLHEAVLCFDQQREDLRQKSYQEFPWMRRLEPLLRKHTCPHPNVASSWVNPPDEGMGCFSLAKAQVTLFLQKPGNRFGDFWKQEECLSFWKPGYFAQLFKCTQRKPLRTFGFQSCVPNSSPERPGRQSEHQPTRSPDLDSLARCASVDCAPCNISLQGAGVWARGLQRGMWDRLWAHTVLKKGLLHLLEAWQQIHLEGVQKLAGRGRETGGWDVAEQTSRAHGTKEKARGKPRELWSWLPGRMLTKLGSRKKKGRSKYNGGKLSLLWVTSALRGQ